MRSKRRSTQPLKITPSKNQHRLPKSIFFALMFAIVGVAFLLAAHAASPYVAIEAENASPSTSITKGIDNKASNNAYVQFHATCPTGQVGTPPNCTTPPTTGHFSLLPLGAALPSEATCATQVRSAAEVRPANNTQNHTKGVGANSTYPRVTGNFTGTTDEIIQWASCKWGLDEDMLRAQAAKESWWFMRSAGDFGTDATACLPGHPIGADGQPGQCPQSIGLLQVRYPYHPTAFLNNNASVSTAYNVDYYLAVWYDCYNGNLGWLNTVERGATYVAGDAWGCFGVWFSGRWMTQPAIDYINAVKDWYNQKIWTTSDFKGAT